MGLLYRRYVPVLLALAVSGTGTVSAGAASYGEGGTAGVGVTADAGKHAGREPEQKPAADEGSQGVDRNPGGSTGSGESAGSGAGKPGSSNGGSGGTGGDGESGSSGTAGSDRDSGSGPDDGMKQGCGDSSGAGGSTDGNSGIGSDNGAGMDADGGTDTDDNTGKDGSTGKGSSAGDESSGGDGTAGSGDSGDCGVRKKNPDIQSGNGNSGLETASGRQKDETAGQRRGSADTGRNPDSTASGSGSTAAEMPETESGENCGPEPGESSRKNTGMLRAAFLAAAAAVLAGLALQLKRRSRHFHGILTDQRKKGIRIVRSRDGTDISVPVLAGKLSSGAVSFQDYKELLMESRSATILPYGTKMAVSATDGETAGAGRPEDADECRMLERLGEIADTAHSRGKTVAANVVLWHDRKDFEIRIHYVFR